MATEVQAPIATASRVQANSRWFSFSSFLGAAAVFVALMTALGRFNDPDLWFHLRLGENIWTTKSIPSVETFSYTAYGHPWTAHEWLTQLSLFAAYRAAGYTGLMVWMLCMSGLLFAILYRLSWRESGNALAAFVGTLCAEYFASSSTAIRPHMVGYTLLAAELLLLHEGARRRRLLWALPPIFALWANCHGSYWFGLGVLGIHWLASLDWRRRVGGWNGPHRLGGILALSAAALCCNPVGWRLLLYPFNVAFVQSTSLAVIQEWQPPDLSSPNGFAMLAIPAAILVAALYRRAELSARDLALLAMALLLASRHVRMLFVFGIVLAPIVSRVLAPVAGGGRRRDHPLLNAALMAGLALILVRAFPTEQELGERVRRTNPVAAVEHIRQAGLAGPMLNEYAFGGYLMWALPEQKVFIDGRGDVFDWTGVLAEYGRWATLAEDPASLLNRRGIRLCLLSRNAPLARIMPYLPGWRIGYSDDVAWVFVR